jgi:lysophospholipase L1-like esterase
VQKAQTLQAMLRKWLGNIVTVLVALVFFVALVATADYMAGLLVAPPDSAALVFPPNSAEAFSSSEFHYTVRTNALGMRDHPVGPRTPGQCRIAVLGDSFTFGFGLELEATWIKQLEARLRESCRQVEVLNLGKAGCGVPHYVEIAQRALPVLQPDILIVALLQGDDLASAWQYEAPAPAPRDRLARWLPGLTHLLLPLPVAPEGPAQLLEAAEQRRQRLAQMAGEWVASLTPEERHRFEAMPADARESTLRGELNLSLIQSAVSAPDFMMNVAKVDTPFVQDCAASTARALRQIRKAAAPWGTRVVVVAVPHGIYVNEVAMRNYAALGFHTDPALLDSDAPDAPLRMAAEQADLDFCSLSSGFRARRDDPGLFFRLDGHYTEAGCKLFAETVQPWVERLLRDYCH